MMRAGRIGVLFLELGLVLEKFEETKLLSLY